MIPSIPSFEFDLIWGSFLTFWAPNGLFWGSFSIFFGPNGLFWGSGQSSKAVLGSTYVVEPSLFSMASLILTFDFDVILGQFFYFLGPSRVIFGVRVGFRICFGVSSYRLRPFIFRVLLYFYSIKQLCSVKIFGSP